MFIVTASFGTPAIDGVSKHQQKVTTPFRMNGLGIEFSQLRQNQNISSTAHDSASLGLPDYTVFKNLYKSYQCEILRLGQEMDSSW